jgi:stearoyl-CoA desaturase (delta-9 desaturase)
MWGSRRFKTRDMSTNNFVVALMTFGEGWHNNHHAHPTSARHGLKWYEVDLNWYGIWALKMLGLAKQIKVVNLAELARQDAPSPNGRLVTVPTEAASTVAGD